MSDESFDPSKQLPPLNMIAFGSLNDDATVVFIRGCTAAKVGGVGSGTYRLTMPASFALNRLQLVINGCGAGGPGQVWDWTYGAGVFDITTVDVAGAASDSAFVFQVWQLP